MNFKFGIINDFIENLKQNENIIGIVEYGSRHYFDNEHKEIGDYDLTVILKKPINKKVSGFHFFINEILIDCMIKTIDEFYIDSPLSPFDLVHLDCSIVFDRNGEVENALNNIKKQWSNTNVVDEWYIERYRYKFKHLLFKANSYHLKGEDIAARYMLDVAFDTFVNFYTKTNDIPLGKYSVIFEHLQKKNTILEEYVCNYQKSVEFLDMYKWMNRVINYILSKHGGEWKKNEILFRSKQALSENEKIEFMSKLIIKKGD